jgi:hypothetical protein
MARDNKTDLRLTVELLGTSTLRQARGNGSGRMIAAEDTCRSGKKRQSIDSPRKEDDAPLGYSGRTALRREQCGVAPKIGL